MGEAGNDFHTRIEGTRIKHHLGPVSSADLALFGALLRGEFALSGIRNSGLRRGLSDLSGAQVSRVLKRLHLHGLVKKVGHSYKYPLTSLGREVCTAALKLRELVVLPSLADLLPT